MTPGQQVALDALRSVFDDATVARMLRAMEPGALVVDHLDTLRIAQQLLRADVARDEALVQRDEARAFVVDLIREKRLHGSNPSMLAKAHQLGFLPDDLRALIEGAETEPSLLGVTRRERDEARAEVAKLKAELVTIAERQREACAAALISGAALSSAEEAAVVRATPLVTEVP